MAKHRGTRCPVAGQSVTMCANILGMCRPAPILRILLAASVLVLLLAPLSQATDRNDHFTPHDTELNLCALALLATAGYWTARQAAAGRRVRQRGVRRPADRVRCAVFFASAQPDADASPPGGPPALLRV